MVIALKILAICALYTATIAGIYFLTKHRSGGFRDWY